MINYKTPGVYVQEIPSFPPSVVPVDTAIPAFIGYTQRISHQGKNLKNVPTKISSMAEYTELFGTVTSELSAIGITFKDNDAQEEITKINTGLNPQPGHRMYYAVQLFFQNGGKECFIVSSGLDNTTIKKGDLDASMDTLKKEDQPTILVFPDALGLLKFVKRQGKYTDGSLQEFYDLYSSALQQCEDLMDRVVLVDVPMADPEAYSTEEIGVFRQGKQDETGKPVASGIGISALKFGIAYYPYLKTSMNHVFNSSEVEITGINGDKVYLNKSELKEDEISLFHSTEYNWIYHKILEAIQAVKIVLPPSAAMAGVYARVDRNQGVHKPPANVSLIGALPTLAVDDEKQKTLNMPDDGKSINAIRPVFGRGTAIVWGARTLDGSDNEWRYVNVRRYFNYVEQSIKQSSYPFVFEPNDKNTWERLKSMIENFLTNEWKKSALAGAKPADAFFVKIGLGSTMTQVDILEGRMNVEIGMAVIRPAEFIILKFSHKMQEA